MIFSNLNLDKDEPIYKQLEMHIMKSIEYGHLKKGDKLPSTREVCDLLKISRNTVVTAYEILESQGILITKKGKGTFINKENCQNTMGNFNIEWKEYINEYGSCCEQLDIIKTEIPWQKGIISFKSIAPDESLFDLEEFKKVFLDVLASEQEKILNYGYAQGYKPLIEYLKSYMQGKGVSTAGKDILITNGFTEGFDIVINSLTRPKDVILTENPTHHTALKIMRARGLEIHGIPMDMEGIEINSLTKVIRDNDIKFVYLAPSYQNPTGIVMSGRRRRKVYEILSERKIPLIEDGFNEELLYSGSHTGPIISFANNESSNGIIYIGSFSKILFPGLRIGWILADKELIKTLESVKRARTIHNSTIGQSILFQYLNCGYFEKYLKKVRKFYKEKYTFTLDMVKKYIPYKHITGEGGLHIFLKLNSEIDTRNLLEKCYKRRVLFTPGDIFHVNAGEGKNTLRIGFSRVKNIDIAKGIKIIGEETHQL